MKKCKLTATALAAGMAMFAGSVFAHDPGGALAGTATCLESNFMMADAMNGPWSNNLGKGRVVEMNTTTGWRGITVNNSFTAANAGGPICPPHVSCPGPFKPTGIVSGGADGHAYLTSAAQHAIIEHHRDGTAIRTNPLWPTDPSPDSQAQVGPAKGHGWVPRVLGNSFMPNGNIAQTTCNANFFNAANSDPMGAGETGITFNAFPGPPVATTNSSYLYFPPVYGTDGAGGRAADGRVIIIDQETLEVVDEYTRPTKGAFKDDARWNCPAGVIFTSEGMFVSMFHGDAVFVIDWKAGIDDDKSEGYGRNSSAGFSLDKPKNRAEVIRVIDLSDDGTGSGIVNYSDPAPYTSGHRRDNLRAIRMSEDGTLYGTRRSRSAACLRGEAPGAFSPGEGPLTCNPGFFRQHIFVAAPGSNKRTGTVALEPGVNVIAGMTINRMSGPGCQFVTGKTDLSTVTGDECDVETIYVGVSAGNAGCPIQTPNAGWECMVPGGTVYEYRLDAAHLDGGALAGDGSGLCDGDHAGGIASYGLGGSNSGCALPIAQFDFVAEGDFTANDTSPLADGTIEKTDPRMVMTIHEAFTQ